jgi:LuxR family maltose regulon positive regulatory protein
VTQPVTVITAPAGYGKTVLVDQWASEHLGPAIARVKLEPDDDWPSAAARIDAALPSCDESILVIEAVDAPTDERVSRGLATLIDRLSPAVQLVLVGRAPSAPPLHGLHGSAGVAYLTVADLAFTRTETRQLVRAEAKVALDGEILDRLQTQTQGWAVGVHVAAIGLRHAADPGA